jgi:hypothetical protein
MLPATVAECAQKGAVNSLARFLERDCDDFNQRLPIARNEQQFGTLRCKLMGTWPIQAAACSRDHR